MQIIIISYFKDQQIHPGTKYDITREKNKLRLLVKNVTIENEGQYTCRVADVKTQCHVIVDEENVRFVERLTDIGAKRTDPKQEKLKSLFNMTEVT